MSDGLAEAVAKMRAAAVPEPAIDVFARQYARLVEGETGVIPSAELEPVRDVPRLEDLPEAPADALARTVVIKLNGGLGTSMGLRHAKSLAPAREGRTFLDLIVTQVEAVRGRLGVRLPLLLLDSFRTREDTRAALAGREDVTSVLQHREPRLRAEDLHPVSWPADPDLEWCPPGHG